MIPEGNPFVLVVIIMYVCDSSLDARLAAPLGRSCLAVVERQGRRLRFQTHTHPLDYNLFNQSINAALLQSFPGETTPRSSSILRSN